MASPETTALAVSVLGDDLGGHDVDVLEDIFMADRIGEDILRQHLEALDEKGESYLTFLQGLKEQPAMRTMYGFIVGSGPDGVYGLLQQMGAAGLVNKKKVTSAARISSTRARPPRQWFRQIWDELSSEGYTYLDGQFKARLDEFRGRFPEIDSENITDLHGYLVACGRSTLNSGVDHHTVEQTSSKTSIALGFRLDMHSPKRNGGWDPKANDGSGGYTADWEKKQAAKAAADAEDTSDEASAEAAK